MILSSLGFDELLGYPNLLDFPDFLELWSFFETPNLNFNQFAILLGLVNPLGFHLFQEALLLLA